MRSNTFIFLASRFFVPAQVVALFCALPALALGAPPSSQAAAATSQPVQTSFATPKEAADALILAAASYDVPALMAMFGPDGKDIVSSADAVRDINSAASFAAEAHEKTEVVVDPKNPKRAILSVGNEEWPLPGPDAPLGKLDYMIEGGMIGGFALVAVLLTIASRASRHSWLTTMESSTRKTWGPIRSRASRTWNSTIRTRPGALPLPIGDIMCSTTERQPDHAGIIFSKGKFK